jgi:hypothetical protein
MTASAAAARTAAQMSGSTGLVVIVVGGLIEGLALGILQAAWLSRRYPGLSRVWWIVTTVAVAGIGWTLASAPAAMGDGSGPSPSVIVVLAASAALGATMGVLLGAAQALVLRGTVRHPWRWVWISAIAWAPTMVVIFAGATLPDATWSTPPVIAVGVITGLLAGAVLGTVSLLPMGRLTAESVPSRGVR